MAPVKRVYFESRHLRMIISTRVAVFPLRVCYRPNTRGSYSSPPCTDNDLMKSVIERVLMNANGQSSQVGIHFLLAYLAIKVNIGSCVSMINAKWYDTYCIIRVKMCISISGFMMVVSQQYVLCVLCCSTPGSSPQPSKTHRNLQSLREEYWEIQLEEKQHLGQVLLIIYSQGSRYLFPRHSLFDLCHPSVAEKCPQSCSLQAPNGRQWTEIQRAHINLSNRKHLFCFRLLSIMNTIQVTVNSPLAISLSILSLQTHSHPVVLYTITVDMSQMAKCNQSHHILSGARKQHYGCQEVTVNTCN